METIEDLKAAGILLTEDQAAEQMRLIDAMSPEERERMITAPHAPELWELFDKPTLPIWSEHHMGRWSLTDVGCIMARGFFTGLRKHSYNNFVLKKDGTVWMSCTHMEIESHLIHLHNAHGRVVNCGLGMGFSMLNFAALDEVDEVVTIERDPDVIEMFYETSSFHTLWPQEYKEKCTIICQDAFEPVPGYKSCDFLYVDIWESMGSETMPEDTARIFNNFDHVGEVGMWTQEIDFITWLLEDGGDINNATESDWRNYCDVRDMPICTHQDERYYDLMPNVAQNMISY
jgi:hypothetical protein